MSDIETTFTDVPGSGERHLRPRKLTEKAYQIYEEKVNQNLSELRDLRKDIESDLSSIQNSLRIPDIPACTAMKNDLLPRLTAYSKISDNFISYLKRIHIEESKLELTNHKAINDVFYPKIDTILNEIDDNPSNGIEEKIHTQVIEAEINFQQSTPIPDKPKVLSQSTPRRSSGLVHMPSIARSSKSYNSSTILLQQNAKIDAAKTRLKYAEKKAELKRQQAEIDRQKAEIELDMDLLQKQSEVEEAEAELNAMNSQLDQHSDHISSVSERQTTPVDKAREERTRSYIEDQNSRIKAPAAKTYSHYSNPCFLNPEARDFTPNYPQATVDKNSNTCISTELTKFLLKKDLLLSRFTNFDDQPETFSIWKSTFLNTVRELDVTPSEELDLLVKWLGPESSKHAVSLRQSNANNPARGLERIWKRLDERYGGAEKVEANLKKRLTDFPKVTSRDYKKLYELSDILTEIESVKEDPNYAQLLSYYDTSLGINPVVSKLPFHLQNKWFDRAAKYKLHKVIFPPFTFFVNYIGEMSNFLNDPGFIIEQPKPIREDPRISNSSSTGFHHKKFNKTPVATKKTEVAARTKQDENTSSSQTKLCLLHKTAHSLNDCRTFRAKPYEERQEFLRDNKVCYRCCDSKDHNFRTCTVAVKCSDCGSTQHPTALHKPRPDKPAFKTSTTIPHGGEQPETNKEETNISSKCTTICGNAFGGKSCAKTVLADVFPTGQSHKAVRTYVIIDEQSNRTLAKPKLLDQLKVTSEPVSYTLTSCSGNINTSGRHANGLSIQSIDGTTTMELPTIIECRDIPNDRSEISTPDIAKQYEHLKEISTKIPALDSDADILLLIGRDLIEAHHVQEQIVGPRNSPFAQRLNLGWVIVGEVCLNQTHKPTVVNVNKTHTLPNGRNTILEPCQNSLQLKEHQLQDYLNSKLTPQDHIGESVFIRTKNDEKIGTSREDKQFLQIMDKEFHQNKKGNWTAPLPFRTLKPNLPNNRSLALHRAKLLDTSLKKNPLKRQHINNVTFMKKVIDSGAAEIAPALTQKDCWYLPIFGVYHPKKPDQIRGVFDSSALYEGTSLNNVLLTGPDLINNLLGVLLRFRKDEFAVTADIEQMFYSFFVSEDHRDYLRFFWYKENNPDKDLIEYRMRVHVFGNSPSPAVATYGLRRAVEHTDPDIKDFVNNNFYVDDALTSLPTSQQAVNLLQRTQKALKENGNIRLHKIASNSESVLNAFQPEDLSKDLKTLELGQDVLPTQRSLGLAWNMQLDTFTFNIELEDKPYTRRGVLSIVNSLFDPMGFIAPVIIHGKHLLREMIAHGTDWDQPLLPDHEAEWIEWKNSLQLLEDLTIPRMYLPTSVSTADSIELHLYSDASEKAISAVAYMRTVNHDGTDDIGFVMGKSRLSPQLGHTIPRLELCAAVMAVEIAETIHDNLDIHFSLTKFYTDSKVVLGYINNQNRRFYTYVSNRVDRILQSTTSEQWNYVCTNKNPADQGSRCLSTTNIKDSMWLLGPPQLHCRDDCIPLEACHTLVNPELDKEIRPEIRVTKTNIVDNLSNRFLKFSSWTRLVNAISYLKRVAQYHKSKSDDIQPRSIESFQEAENYIIELIQKSFYSEELQCLKDNKPISKNSDLRQLDPILDGESILRIGGRLNKSNLSKELKNPVIIPGKSHIASLLVTHYHQQVQHQGRHFTEGNIRSNGYWITGAKRLISSILHQCFKCRKLRGTLEHQKMADLPIDRLTPGPPFTSVGVDTFGPWSIVTRRTRGGAANSKRWALVFSCLTTRAIHIEVIEELSSSAFINALRRFVALRGDVKEFRSDRGTNFVGATNDLKIDTINVEDNPVKEFLFNSGTVWIFNAPHSSHMGGAWERMIGVTRKILDSMLIDSKHLTHDVLTTLMAEVCAIINARPISTISSDPESPEIISPALLLTQKVGIKPVSTENFSLTNIYRSQWKHVQMLSDIFWKHWKGDYLNSLQQRRKWNDDRPNIKTGDVVLLKDREVHRNKWPLGIITNAIPSDDGKIRKVEVRITKDGKPTKYTRPINEVVILIN